MIDQHITTILEKTSFTDLTNNDIATIERHTLHCDRCLQSYQAARLAALLIKAKTKETAQPSPFFSTRVMAAIRERKLLKEEPILLRMWKIAGTLVSAMVVLVVILVVLTLVIHRRQPEMGQIIESTDTIMLEQDTEKELAYDDQVLRIMYEAEDNNGN